MEPVGVNSPSDNLTKNDLAKESLINVTHMDIAIGPSGLGTSSSGYKEIPASPVTLPANKGHLDQRNSWNFIWEKADENATEKEYRQIGVTKSRADATIHPPNANPSRKKDRTFNDLVVQDIDVRENILERREREFDRKEREFDRRERELERRERELERRQREFDRDKMRWNDVQLSQESALAWQPAITTLKHEISSNFTAERKRLIDREEELEKKIMNRVNNALEKERQLYGVMRMSDNEVHEMMESSVGYLLQNDEEIADRVRFHSLLYLAQDRLALEAGLSPPPGSDSLSLAWRVALGPSVATEDRSKKALELLTDKVLADNTKKVIENKKALEYTVEYNSHLRREGNETSEYSFSFGRISHEDYTQSIDRHFAHDSEEHEALRILVDFISPSTLG